MQDVLFYLGLGECIEDPADHNRGEHGLEHGHVAQVEEIDDEAVVADTIFL